MDTTRSSSYAPLFVIAVLVVLLIAYVSGYYLLGSVGTAGPARLRVYRYPWMVGLFMPAAQVESFILRQKVLAVHPVEER